MTERSPRTLLILSHVTHHRHEGRLFAYGPYAREIDQWAALFEHVTISAPCTEAAPPGDALPFEAPNIDIASHPETGGTTIGAKLHQLIMLPIVAWKIGRAMARADAIQVRCPANVGLLGILLAPFFSRYLVAKYAGQWSGYPGEAWTVRLQRRLLGSRWWHGPVLVYGRHGRRAPQVVPFFATVLSERQLDRARTVASGRTLSPVPRILYVGRLDDGKNVHVLIDALAQLHADGIPVRGIIVGQGPDRAALEARAERAGLSAHVEFRGGLPFQQVLDAYEVCDILVLASESEGWPKAIVEAMAFGLVCVGSTRGLMPEILGEGRGYVVPPGDPKALADVLRQIIADPPAAVETGRRASAWASQFSLEHFSRAIRTLLEDRWGTRLDSGPVESGSLQRTAVMHMVDTLDAGGAERVAVNLVNALDRIRYTAHLCTTRREGPLGAEVAPHVHHLRLARHARWDLAAFARLVAYNRAHNIRLIHAHNTSIFIAAAASFFPPYPAIIWHDHFGRYAVEERPAFLYRLAVRRARMVIAVNEPLAEWSRHRLRMPASRVRRIPNFVRDPASTCSAPLLTLPGEPGARIVCVANLRPEKDHLTLLAAMRRVVAETPTAHLLLVGGSSSHEHAEAVRRSIDELGLGRHVTMLGERHDVPAVLRACDIGVLSSASEGFPLALLEYGMAGLPAVATRVGQCAEALDDGRVGLLVPPRSPDALAEALLSLLRAPERRAQLGAAFRDRVRQWYSEESVLAQVCAVYELALARQAAAWRDRASQ
jgi:glycosyltransferase involved in cell wall biosynthesis